VAAIISCGIPREKFEFLRHFSVFNIVSLLCVILVAGFWLAACETLPVGDSQQGYKDTVSFGYAYYIYISSGVFSLIATSLNLLRGRSAAERRRNRRRNFRQQLLFRSHHPNHWFPLQRTTRTVSQLNLQVTRSPNDDPPDYSQIATTSFINNNDDNDNTTIADNNDTELLLNEPPPYVP
jgi:hypothetical protein